MDSDLIRILRPLLALLGSLTFGALLGGGLAGLFYTCIVIPSAPAIPFTPFFASGLFLGSALHKLIEGAWNLMLGPIFKMGKTEIQLFKLHRYAKRGLVSQATYCKLADMIIREDILGVGYFCENQLPQESKTDRSDVL